MKNVYTPTLATFRQLSAAGANLIPVYREFPADLETPVTVYLKLMSQMGPSFLLESVTGGEFAARYSFVGVNPRKLFSLHGETLTSYDENGYVSERELAEKEDILHVLEDELDGFVPAQVEGLPRFIGGAVGYLGYDMVRFFERLPETAVRVTDMPDSIFMIADTLVVFDHIQHKLKLLSNARVGDDIEQAYLDAVQNIERVAEHLLRPLPAIPSRRYSKAKSNSPIESNKNQEEFEAMVRTAKEHIAAGDIFQVVLSQRFSRETDAHPFAIYRALRMVNPSPYMFYYDFNNMLDVQLIGASPEVHVRLEDGTASLRPIAGTRKRGKNEAEDLALEQELLADEKEVAEHVMLIDLGRNDIGRVSEYGTVEVTDLMVVERYSHVMHIVSQVEGKLKADMNAFDLMRATLPAGTLSGAPKVRAMEIIEALEGERRGLYGGAVGYFSYDGNMDTCIAIRTLYMIDDRVYGQAGAGIVADSVPTSEYHECVNKITAVFTAVDKAENGLT